MRSADFVPVKATAANVYIVQKQNSGESPNYFATTNFRKYYKLSEIHPEKNYNWYTAEMVRWAANDKINCQGLLYKPEDFDSSKKYPVIFSCYTILSDNRHISLFPRPSEGGLNIATYVSNGYLVFVPDITYRIGDAYQSCYEIVASAAKYLQQRTYVNKDKMAIQGISWGGFQVNYLATKTNNLFAAICTSSGVADFVSSYNGLHHGGAISQDSYEDGAHGPVGTLWENKKWYLENSPVMNADRVQSPVLMFHTTQDNACPFVNGLEFFLALRRLGKKVWLLEYNDGNHGVYGNSGYDFDLRMQQFFNYYLKDAAPPKWMTVGRHAALKFYDAALELDTSGLQP
jgi:dipeptidyl aminopeptidase/acylaminoacyl peptidase